MPLHSESEATVNVKTVYVTLEDEITISNRTNGRENENE